MKAHRTTPATAIKRMRILQADYGDTLHAEAILKLLDAYAQDPAGGNTPLSKFTKHNLVQELAKRPQAFSVLAFDGGMPVGLVNCIEGFSTFACEPLVNVHDVAVVASHRGRRLAEHIAIRRGACKLTLEVLNGNLSATKLYERIGFSGYQLDPTMGHAVFLQKWLTPKS